LTNSGAVKLVKTEIILTSLTLFHYLPERNVYLWTSDVLEDCMHWNENRVVSDVTWPASAFLMSGIAGFM
jgi:hypothetical protein